MYEGKPILKKIKHVNYNNPSLYFHTHAATPKA